MKSSRKFLSLPVILALLLLSAVSANAWPDSPCNPCVPRCTYTQGGWGAPCSGGNAGCILQDNFAVVYPAGLTVGGFYTIHFTSAGAVRAFLPNSATSAVLTRNYVNPGQSPHISVLAGQIVALQLNVDFGSSGLGAFTPLGDLVIVSGTFAGYTITNFLALANTVLGGDTTVLPSGSDLGDLNSTCTAINLNFDNCTDNDGFLITPPAAATVYVRDVGEVLPRTFCLNFTLQCPDICVVWWCQHCDESHDFATFTATPGCTSMDCSQECTPNPGALSGFEFTNQHLIGPDPSGVGCWWYTQVHATDPGCFCVTFDSQLPVKLLDFTATAGNNEVTITWMTASETANDYFEVQRDGAAMTRLRSTGNDATGESYTWRDDAAQNGTSYRYTLIAIDIRGERWELGSISASPSADNAAVNSLALHQNYPNPFNPATTIGFDLLESGNVSLAVYNLMGQSVATLVSGTMSAGHHIAAFDAAALPSGIYLYRLTAGGVVAEKKMLLMK